LIVFDIRLLVIRGHDLLQDMLWWSWAPLIIVLTQSGDAAAVARIAQSNHMDILHEPFDVEDLLIKARELTTGSPE
jgi:DNA-binding response OmpR family regulator